MNKIDPDGGSTDDWYELLEAEGNGTGTYEWFDTDWDHFSNEKGSWVNAGFGDELLEFDGADMIYSIQTRNKYGTLQLNQFTFSADSGKPFIYEDPNSWETTSFNYSPERQLLLNEGPIPEGKYHVFKDRMQSREGLSNWQKTKSNLGGGQWRGGTKSWGKFRFEVYPKSIDLGGGIIRGDFFVHGGDVRGSAGCIDLCNNMTTFKNAFMLGQQNKVHLIVHYD